MAKFTFEDKLWAVKEYENGKLSHQDIAKKLGAVKSTVETWVNLHRIHGEDSLRKSYTNYFAEFKSYRGNAGKVAPNVLNRNFKAETKSEVGNGRNRI